MFDKLVKYLTHKHDYIKVGFQQVENNNVRYSLRKYKCLTCGKEKWVDGRFDKING